MVHTQMKVAVLGPEYSYSYIVGLKVFPRARVVLCDQIGQVFREVEAGSAEKGIVPIENINLGHLRESVDGLLENNVRINYSYTMAIHHCLAAQSQDYKVIISKQEALDQCSAFLAGKKVDKRNSTSKAMEDASKDPAYAAIGSIEAAIYHGLEILQENIGNNANNATRFLEISLKETLAQENARTSFVLSPRGDYAGLLRNVLNPFADEGINLAQIESRPTQMKMGERFFYIELDCNLQEERMQRALVDLERLDIVDIRSLGSYQLVDLR